MKSVLLIGPKYLNLYLDIIEGFHNLGYEVDFVSELTSRRDSLNVRRWNIPSIGSEKKKKKYWQSMLRKEEYSKKYDILFVLDGQGLHRCLFDNLKKRNPQLKCYNYLFDTIKSVYKFNVFSSYFDKVFSFDKGESKLYGFIWLPIYWVEQPKQCIEKYDMFGFGAYNSSRLKVFGDLNLFSEKHFLNSYIKLYYPLIHREWLYSIMKEFGKPWGIKYEMSLDVYHSSIMVQTPMPPSQFREMINASKIIIDTHHEDQDGMTARFMWAIGARKKIITDNESIVDYAFYSPSQIFILKKSFNTEEKNKLWEFLNSPLELSADIQSEIDKYRIDSWLQTILN